MNTVRAFGFLVKLVMLAASLVTAGPIDETIRALAVFVAVVVSGVVLFCAVVLAVALRGQRRPPYPMQSAGWEE
jgi:hypothetical protein